MVLSVLFSAKSYAYVIPKDLPTIEALIALGYSSSEAAKAVSKVVGQTNDANQMIFLALKGLG